MKKISEYSGVVLAFLLEGILILICLALVILLSPITYFYSTVPESIRTESSRWVLGDTVSVELVTAN